MWQWKRLGTSLILIVGWILSSQAYAQLVNPTVPLLPQLEIVRLERDLLALGAAGGEARVRLELDEQVVWLGSQGVVGAVVTDRRLLCVSLAASGWQEVRFQRDEQPAVEAGLGDRVVLAHTSRRIFGFGGFGGTIREYRLGPNERLGPVHVGEGVGVALTSRKALGFSSKTGGFFETSIGLRERVEFVDVRADLATVQTNRRLLIFRGVGGAWGERRRELNGS